jgi:hypothetical protein
MSALKLKQYAERPELRARIAAAAAANWKPSPMRAEGIKLAYARKRNAKTARLILIQRRVAIRSVNGPS